MKILAIIPARGGSKGLPNKNILPLGNHPLIAYSIAAGLKTPEINRVICSTDSEKIRDVAISYGAEVPFLRPAEFAQDHSGDLEVFTHALNWLNTHESYIPDFVVQLRPTSPIRFIHDIQKGLEIIKNNSRIDSLRAVSEPITTPYKMWTIKEDGFLSPLLKIDNNPEPYNTARQLLPRVWVQNGTLEIIRTKTILEKKSMTGTNIYPLITANETYVDIDSKANMTFAELIIKELQSVSP